MNDSTEPASPSELGEPGEPLVVVCLRPADPATRVDPLTGRIDRDPGALDLPAAEAAALEHALRIAEAWQGRVLAVTAGDEAADEPLRQVMALGVDVLRVPWPPSPGPGAPGAHGSRPAPGEAEEAYVTDLAADERSLAEALAGAVRGAAGPRGPALVLCGDRSAERGTGALPAFLAHALGAAQALGLVRLGAADGHLLAERRLDGGRRERLRVPLPAVCSVEAAGVRLRRAGLPGLLGASAAAIPIETGGAGGFGLAAGALNGLEVARARPYRPPTRVVPPPSGTNPRERLLELTGALVAHDPPTVVGPVVAAEAADVLLEFLRRTGHLPADLVDLAAAPPAPPLAASAAPAAPASSP